MRKQLISLAFLAVVPLAAHAQEEAKSGFNWNAAATSEYLFRGISQTDDHPAIQAGAGYSFSNGLYVGGWASNVDFGRGDTKTSAEIDGFVGWKGDVGATNLDVQLIRYGYIGEPKGVNYAYNELVGKLTFAENYTATLGYTNNYLNAGNNSYYAGLGGSWPIGHDYNLTANAGYTKVQNGAASGYVDYGVGVNRSFGPVNIAVGYAGTSGSADKLFGKDNSENKFLLTFTVGG